MFYVHWIRDLWEEVELVNVAEDFQIERRQPCRDEDSVFFGRKNLPSLLFLVSFFPAGPLKSVCFESIGVEFIFSASTTFSIDLSFPQ